MAGGLRRLQGCLSMHWSGWASKDPASDVQQIIRAKEGQKSNLDLQQLMANMQQELAELRGPRRSEVSAQPDSDAYARKRQEQL